MSGRYLLLKTKQHIPATSAIIATTVSSTLQRLRQNRFSFHQTRKEMNLEAARSCLWADWCPNRWRMDGESWRTWFVMSTHPDRAQTWLFRTQQAPDFTLPTCFQNKRVVVNTHTHCQRSGKALELSQEQYIKRFYTSSFRKNENLLRSGCVIHQQVSLVVYRRNKLARTWKLPELPSQKSPVSPDGGLVHWTGKGKKQAKHSSSLFTHICTHLTSTCTHKNTHRKLLSAYAQHMQRANPLHLWLFSETRALTNTAASLNWHRDLAWEHRWCLNAAGGKKVLGFKIINISVRKIVS